MKRSEMINAMWEYIQTVDNDYYEKYIDKDNIEFLLELIEQLGMKPPLIKAKGFFGDEYRHEWEKE